MFKPSQLIRRGFTPAGVYAVLIHAVTVKRSRKENPMAELDCEILSPEEVAHRDNGQLVTYATGHTRFRAWWVLAPNDFLPENIAGLQTIGVKVLPEYEDPGAMIEHVLGQLPALLERKIIDVALTTRPNFARRPLTQEEAARGETEGEILRDPATGKEKVLNYNIQMNINAVCSTPRDSGRPF